MTPVAFRRLALSLSGTTEQPHFERTSFRVGKRIFATLTADGTQAMVVVKPVERCYSLIDSAPAAFFDHGGWTERMGALGVRLAEADDAQLAELVREAWRRLADAEGKPRPGGAGGKRAEPRRAKPRKRKRTEDREPPR